MAIDMIEYNEMGALAPSRLGMRNFVNDKSYKGKPMPKMEENFAELFGSKKRKKLRKSVSEELSQLPSGDCQTLEQSIRGLEEDLATLVKRSSTEKGGKRKNTDIQIQETQNALGRLKKVRAKECEALEAQRKKEEEAAFEQKLVALSEESVQKAKEESESLGQKVSKNKNILLIGGGIVALGIVGYIIFGKK